MIKNPKVVRSVWNCLLKEESRDSGYWLHLTFMAKFDVLHSNILTQFSTSNKMSFSLTAKERLYIQHPEWKRKETSDMNAFFFYPLSMRSNQCLKYMQFPELCCWSLRSFHLPKRNLPLHSHQGAHLTPAPPTQSEAVKNWNLHACLLFPLHATEQLCGLNKVHTLLSHLCIHSLARKTHFHTQQRIINMYQWFVCYCISGQAKQMWRSPSLKLVARDTCFHPNTSRGKCGVNKNQQTGKTTSLTILLILLATPLFTCLRHSCPLMSPQQSACVLSLHP